MLQPFPLYPGDTDLDFLWDWTTWLNAGDTIASFVVTVSDGLVLGNSSTTGQTVTAWFTLAPGVSVGQSMSATVEITTVGGRIDSRDMTFTAKRQ